MKSKKNKKLECLRCGNIWNQRFKTKPKRCPICKNPNWNKKKIKDFVDFLFK